MLKSIVIHAALASIKSKIVNRNTYKELKLVISYLFSFDFDSPFSWYDLCSSSFLSFNSHYDDFCRSLSSLQIQLVIEVIKGIIPV